MRNAEDVANLVKKVHKKYGRIDILINNAGQGMHVPVEKADIGQFKEIMELNLYGALRAMQEVIPHMRRQGGGMIINVGSGLTKMYIPGTAPYSATKYALNAISLIARQELAKDGIVVSVIHPKMTATNFFKEFDRQAPRLWRRRSISADGHRRTGRQKHRKVDCQWKGRTGDVTAPVKKRKLPVRCDRLASTGFLKPVSRAARRLVL